MFDDHFKQNQGQVPGNLPVGEPDDMFAGAPEVPPAVDAPPSAPEPDLSPAAGPASTALDAGVLRPKSQTPPSSPPPSPSSDTAPNYGQPSISEGLRPEENVLKDPFGGKKVLFTVVTLVSLAILGGGGAWVYFSFIAPQPLKPAPTVPAPNNTSPQTPPPNTNPVVTPPPTTSQPVNGSVTTTDEKILFGEPVLDTDSDGLDDATEKKINTNMLAWDSDGDTLSDGDEVLTWKTDPLKADTDGDTYNDGEEIRNGYNPKGTGKLFPVTPTSTEQK